MTAISGAAGYVGRRLLDAYPAATGYDLPGEARNVPGVEVGDFREKPWVKWVCEDHDTLFHLAALSGVADCNANPVKAVEQNVETLTAAARACSLTDTHLIFPSSQAIYGDSVYGSTKVACERIIESLPLDATVLEFSNIYGAYDYRGEVVSKGTVVDYFIDRARAGEPLTVHAPGTQRRNFIHIDDVLGAYGAATDCTGRYTVTGPDTVTIRQLADIVDKYGKTGIEMVEADRSGTEIDAPDVEADLPYFEPARDLDVYVRRRLSE